MAELNNLDALAEQLFNEGMDKAHKESEKLLNETKQQAEERLAEAEKEASEIVAKAKKEAEKYRSSVETEVYQKAKQFKQDLSIEITKMITAEALINPTNELMSDQEFVKELIISTLDNWKEGRDLQLSIPTKLEEMKATLEKKTHSILPELVITTNYQLDSGFKISNQKDGYELSFTEADFNMLFKSYLSKAVRKILFEDK
ncbi:MAG: hypothetical protein NXI20_06365 [bacterium]|nr:hypothetical protein [bacterium]